MYPKIFASACPRGACSTCRLRHQTSKLWAVDTSGSSRDSAYFVYHIIIPLQLYKHSFFSGNVWWLFLSDEGPRLSWFRLYHSWCFIIYAVWYIPHPVFDCDECIYLFGCAGPSWNELHYCHYADGSQENETAVHGCSWWPDTALWFVFSSSKTAQCRLSWFRLFHSLHVSSSNSWTWEPSTILGDWESHLHLGDRINL